MATPEGAKEIVMNAKFASKQGRALVLGILGTLVGAALGGPAQAVSSRLFEARVECEEMLALLPVDASVARSKVPLDYELTLAPDGSAVLVFATKLCSWDVPGRPFVPATEEVHAYLSIEGPFQIIPVPGAPVTQPSAYAYSLFYDVEGGPMWLRGQLKSYGLNVRHAEEVEIGPYGAFRVGHVAERGAQGQGYRWRDIAAPVEPTLFGQHNFFNYDKNPGERVHAEAAQLFQLTAQGMIVLEIDPKSSLADFGPVLLGQTFHFHPMQSDYVVYNE